MIRADNLFEHADGGRYCLLIPEAPMKHPVSGEWVPGVVYTGTDGVIRSTTRERWDERFTPVAEIAANDLNEAELMMIRRSNPGDVDFDFLRVMESWHESEMGITGHMLELAVAAAMEKLIPEMADGKPTLLTITTEDLQRVVQTYEVERVPQPHGFTFCVTKS